MRKYKQKRLTKKIRRVGLTPLNLIRAAMVLKNEGSIEDFGKALNGL